MYKFVKLCYLMGALVVFVGCAAKEENIVTTLPSAGYKSEIEAYKKQEAARTKSNPIVMVGCRIFWHNVFRL